MAAQSFQYTKISELQSTTTATDDSLLVINVSGNTKMITYAVLKNLITSAISQSLAHLRQALVDLTLGWARLKMILQICRVLLLTLSMQALTSLVLMKLNSLMKGVKSYG